MFTLIGYRRSVGEHQGEPFDYTYIYGTRPANPSDNETGTICKGFKMKTELFPSDIEIGSNFIPTVNDYGRCTNLKVINP